MGSRMSPPAVACSAPVQVQLPQLFLHPSRYASIHGAAAAASRRKEQDSPVLREACYASSIAQAGHHSQALLQPPASPGTTACSQQGGVLASVGGIHMHA